ncbi:pitrilysin family protein [Clostridiaceae bacterium M8S5]|nr:pitrilysin family protein [Clostridiaceae bacterium M8S5]
MYNKITLDNGLRVVIEEIPHVRSVTIGLWIKAGSVNESEKNNGITHFIEHMLFKGTKKRTAKQLAQTIDDIGGQLNAFTAKECTCYYTRVLDNHIDIAVDVLSDMLFNSKFDEEDIKKEKKVVLEEINMYDDTPEEIVHDLISKSIYSNHSLGFPILGQAKNLEDMTRNQIIDYFHDNYIPENAVLTIVGNIRSSKGIELIKQYFGHWKGNKKGSIINTQEAIFNTNALYEQRETEQLHLCMGMQGIPLGDKYYYAMMVLNNIFGGCMSSRLFQKVREDKGLAYSIYSYPLLYSNTGAFIIYAGINPKYMIDVVETILKEIKTIKKNLIEDSLLQRSKEQLKGNYIMDYESMYSRMMSMGKTELLLGRIVPLSKGLEKIDKVTLDDIKYIIDLIFDENKRNVSYVGNLDDEKSEKLLSMVPIAQEA